MCLAVHHQVLEALSRYDGLLERAQAFRQVMDVALGEVDKAKKAEEEARRKEEEVGRYRGDDDMIVFSRALCHFDGDLIAVSP